MKKTDLEHEHGSLAVFFADQCDGVTGIQKEDESLTTVTKSLGDAITMNPESDLQQFSWENNLNQATTLLTSGDYSNKEHTKYLDTHKAIPLE